MILKLMILCRGRYSLSLPLVFTPYLCIRSEEVVQRILELVEVHPFIRVAVADFKIHAIPKQSQLVK